MTIYLHIWRQAKAGASGRMVRYEVKDVSHHMSFLELLDVLNEELTNKGEDPIAFDHDCREGICGMCGFMVNGVAHGPMPRTTLCQLHMRHFKDDADLYLEPWRARRQRHPGPQGKRGTGHGRGRLHRLRRLRSRVPHTERPLQTRRRAKALASLATLCIKVLDNIAGLAV